MKQVRVSSVIHSATQLFFRYILKNPTFFRLTAITGFSVFNKKKLPAQITESKTRMTKNHMKPSFMLVLFFLKIDII